MAPRSANSMKPVFISLLYSYTDSSVYARSLWRMWLALLDYQIFLFGGDTSGVSILLLFAICAVSEFLIISKEIKIAIVEWYMNVLSAFFLSMGICLIQIKVYWLIAWFIDSYFWICNTVEFPPVWRVDINSFSLITRDDNCTRQKSHHASAMIAADLACVYDSDETWNVWICMVMSTWFCRACNQ